MTTVVGACLERLRDLAVQAERDLEGVVLADDPDQLVIRSRTRRSGECEQGEGSSRADSGEGAEADHQAPFERDGQATLPLRQLPPPRIRSARARVELT